MLPTQSGGSSRCWQLPFRDPNSLRGSSGMGHISAQPGRDGNCSVLSLESIGGLYQDGLGAGRRLSGMALCRRGHSVQHTPAADWVRVRVLSRRDRALASTRDLGRPGKTTHQFLARQRPHRRQHARLPDQPAQSWRDACAHPRQPLVPLPPAGGAGSIRLAHPQALVVASGRRDTRQRTRHATSRARRDGVCSCCEPVRIPPWTLRSPIRSKLHRQHSAIHGSSVGR